MLRLRHCGAFVPLALPFFREVGSISHHSGDLPDPGLEPASPLLAPAAIRQKHNADRARDKGRPPARGASRGLSPGLRGRSAVQLASLLGRAFLQTGLIHELPLMKSACRSAERLVGPLGPKSTGRESLFPERWAKVRRLILKEPQGQVHPRAVTVLREAGVHPPTWLGCTCPHREPRWSQPCSRQRYWEWRGCCPREIPYCCWGKENGYCVATKQHMFTLIMWAL